MDYVFRDERNKDKLAKKSIFFQSILYSILINWGKTSHGSWCWQMEVKQRGNDKS